MEPMKIVIFILFVCCSPDFSLAQSQRGKWKLLKRSIGVSAMHMQLLPNDKIIAFDRSDFGPSNLTLPQGKCTQESKSSDCYAHSVEFNPATRAVRPLTILSDTWCSSGALSMDGTLVQSGGYRLGEKVIRYLKPSWIVIRRKIKTDLFHRGGMRRIKYCLTRKSLSSVDDISSHMNLSQNSPVPIEYWWVSNPTNNNTCCCAIYQ
ncbi:hypothetical protein F3Y22_tig00116971pilonHSYRG00770 [Hibiscus syriacus]|uniref:Glyoxal oxidase N-terminal domain-containing protein n=1 Tax=Hibiscus syriacus TaxID=106335 RepID=A0A6A2WSU3_HIBSY|nr:hypothetical protein F3Y22_tig00116971pilonHSYRG00770 [Hibiscus syriacus]